MLKPTAKLLSVDILFVLIRRALGDESIRLLPEDIDWCSVIALSKEQDVSAIVLDGLQLYQRSLQGACQDSLSSLYAPEMRKQKYEWYSQTYMTEQNYERHIQANCFLAGLFNSQNIKMLLMKGYGLSLNYPRPEHRVSGDVDIFLYGQGGAADDLIKNECDINVKQNEDKHSTFLYQNILVENHASFTNTVEYPSHIELERFLLSEAEKATPMDLNGSQIYLPTAMFNAVFLPCHVAGHFVYGGMLMKQLVDWAVFVNKYHDEVDWHKVFELADEAGYLPFLKSLNGIVVRYLGVNPCFVPEYVGSVELQNRILDEMFNQCVNRNEERYLDKVKRYFKLKWKYDLVFKDNYYLTFFRRSWASFRGRHLKNSRSVWVDV